MSTRKLLLVDDSTAMLLLERMVLDSSGYQILAAKDGEAGVRAALAHRPDLILLGTVLPKMDAHEVCRQLRAHETTREIPILLVRSRDAQDEVEKGLFSGYDGVIIKPMHPEELLSKVRNLLGD